MVDRCEISISQMAMDLSTCKRIFFVLSFITVKTFTGLESSMMSNPDGVLFMETETAKRISHKLNKLMKSSPIYNKLQHFLIEHACI